MPHPAYEGFARALVAPMIWGGETRGVLGVGLRGDERRFTNSELELLETFASLASLALRNAETYAERTRQARIQRSFYRIASLLGEPLSLEETYDAAAQAAAEALGGDSAAVLVPVGRQGLAVAGGHGLADTLRNLEFPPALEEAAAGGQILAAPDLATRRSVRCGVARGAVRRAARDPGRRRAFRPRPRVLRRGSLVHA